MKTIKILIAALILILALQSKGQYVAIPDTNFGTWLQSNGYSACVTGNNSTGYFMDTTCTMVVNATSINCSNYNIADLTGIQYFDHLQSLNCYINRLSTLPRLPRLLYVLNCDNNQLGSLPALPDSLHYLSCFNNQITNLPVLSPYLQQLICSQNQLTSLPSLPGTLTWLQCDSNHLGALPSLPSSLSVLECQKNQLTVLPALPSPLTNLICNRNHLTAIPALPSLLVSLVCAENQISSLGSLPYGLTNLDCGTNLLTSIASLPPTLNTLVCNNNQITSLPNLQSSLVNLDCSNNLLTSLPLVGGNLSVLICSGNANLTCLPNIRSTLNVLRFDNTLISCMPNRFQCNSYSPFNPATLPLCTGACVGQAGPDQTICYGASTSMASLGTGSWYALSSNPTGTSILSTTSTSTVIIGFMQSGIYAFVWNTAAGADTMNVTVDPEVTVSVSASPDTITTVGNSITLTAIGTPPGGTYQWSPLVFMTPAAGNARTITVTPSIGTIDYFVTYTVNGCNGQNDQQVLVISGASAGSDQTICQNATATMAASGTGTWSALGSNPAVASIANTTVATTTISGFTVGGTYSFVWVSGGAADTVIVIVNPAPDAGPDQSIPMNSATTMAAIGTGIWAALPGNPATTTFANNTSPTSNVSGFTALGTYRFVWANGGCGDTMNVVAYIPPYYVVIPDSNFGKWLHTNGFSPCMIGNSTTGWLLDTAHPLVSNQTFITCPNANIHDLTGITYFTQLSSLQCANNQLTTLPRLPYYLQDLDCQNNRIQSLPFISNLRSLNCQHNQLSSLPNLNAGVQYLLCTSNSLTSLPVLPSTVAYLRCDSNPALSCLPPISMFYLNDFFIGGTNIQCVPNRMFAGSFDIDPSTLPTCGVGNANGCQVYVNIAGSDQTILVNTSASMAAAGTGTWSALASNPAITSFSNSSSATTTITGFTVVGTYSFVWTTASGVDTMNVIVNPSGCGISVFQHSGCAGFSWQVQDTTLGVSTTNTTWYLTLANGSHDTIRNNYQLPAPPVVYGNIIVRMTNTLGCNITDSNFYLYQKPIFRGRPSASVASPGQCIYWRDSSVSNCGSLHYRVDWGNGPLDTVINTCHRYSSIGNYSLSISIINSCGCQVDTTLTNAINIVNFPAGPDQNICQNNSFGYATATMSATGTGTWATLPANPSSTSINAASSPTTYISGFTVPGIYGFVWSSPLPDTVYVTVLPSPARPQLSLVGSCLGSDSLMLTGTYGDSVVWIQNTTNIFTTGHDSVLRPSLLGFYEAFIFGVNGCHSDLSDTVWVTPCPSDSVWPGDANRDGVADNVDLLNIGLAYDSTGSARPAASPVWVAQYGANWADTFATGVNFKFADCDGNGHVTAADTVPLMLNFGLTHTKTDGSHPWRSGQPLIYPTLSSDTVTHGDTLTISINLGQVLLNASNVYGVAFDLNYDPAVIDTNKTQMNFPISWLGGPTDALHIFRDLKSAGVIKTAITRTDHAARSGQGRIAIVRAIVTTDNIDGKDLHYYKFLCSISNVTVVDQNGNVIQVNEGEDSNQVAFTPLGIQDMDALNSSISLYPNPANDVVTIACAKSYMMAVDVTNILGERVREFSYADSRSEHSLDMKGLSSGVYYLSIKTPQGTAIKKLIINH